MITRFSVLLVVLFSMALACCKNAQKSGVVSLENAWRWHKYKDSVSYFTKTNNLDKTGGAFQLIKGGKLKVRQNIGWCGTPPIEYETVTGSWVKTSDTTIQLNYKFWGGDMVRNLVIIKLTSSELQIKEGNPIIIRSN